MRGVLLVLSAVVVLSCGGNGQPDEDEQPGYDQATYNMTRQAIVELHSDPSRQVDVKNFCYVVEVARPPAIGIASLFSVLVDQPEPDYENDFLLEAYAEGSRDGCARISENR